MKCPYCEGKVKAAQSSLVYGHDRFGKIFVCENYPVCDAYVGCHKKNGEALGTVANRKLRNLRKRVHALLDPRWTQSMNKGKARTKVYRWLAQGLGITKEECHVAMFRDERCRLAIDFLKAR